MPYPKTSVETSDWESKKEELKGKKKVYPRDLLSVLKHFLPSNEDKEKQIAQIMFRRAGQKPTQGVPEWYYTTNPIEKDATVVPYIKGSEVEGFVLDFIGVKSYFTH